MALRKIILTLILATGLVLAIGFLRPPGAMVSSGLAENEFWTRKILQKAGYDVVLIGDSRTYFDLSPAEMKRIMIVDRIYNFGVKYGGLTREYLEAGAALLDPQSPRKIIVLGITPHSLTVKTARSNGFIDLKKQDFVDRMINLRLSPFMAFLGPLSLRDIIYKLLGKPYSSIFYVSFFPDGWAAGRKVPPTLEGMLAIYQNYYKDNPLEPKTMAAVMSMTAQWKSQGIRVFGFRPPTPPQMAALEYRLSGFEQEKFVKDFEAAGGVWLSFDPSRYSSYDGSHLDRDSAREFSRDLARAMVNRR